MTTLDELLERIEKATAPDRVLDVALCLALGYIAYSPLPLNLRPSEDDGAEWLDYEVSEDGKLVDCSDKAPELTASIDAALALVERRLPGWFWRGGHVPSFHWTGSRNVDCWAHLSRTDASNCDEGDEATGWCDTVPLAILAALLRALIVPQEAVKE